MIGVNFKLEGYSVEDGTKGSFPVVSLLRHIAERVGWGGVDADICAKAGGLVGDSIAIKNEETVDAVGEWCDCGLRDTHPRIVLDSELVVVRVTDIIDGVSNSQSPRNNLELVAVNVAGTDNRCNVDYAVGCINVAVADLDDATRTLHAVGVVECIVDVCGEDEGDELSIRHVGIAGASERNINCVVIAHPAIFGGRLHWSHDNGRGVRCWSLRILVFVVVIVDDLDAVCPPDVSGDSSELILSG